MTDNLSVIIAFSAGLLSFLSPCVLPLIPSWLCIIGGSPMTGTIHQAEEAKYFSGYKASRPRPIARTVSFIFGFSAVFVILSIIFTVTFNLMGSIFGYINLIAGIIVIILGFNTLFNFLSFLNYEKRLRLKNKPKGIISAFFAGIAFGAGWTPCIGPVLTSILLLAAQNGGIPQAALYLFFFSAGLGLPFLIAAFSFDFFLKASVKLRIKMPVIQRISGALLIIIGVLIITGRYQQFSALVASW